MTDRDFVGYGEHPPDPQWPDGARLALNFVLNYEEGAHIRHAIEAIERATGQRPVGWYTGRISDNTRRLVVEEGGFLYDSDSYADELPYWLEVGGQAHLVIPYTLDVNDFKFLL